MQGVKLQADGKPQLGCDRLPDDVLTLADQTVRVPIYGRAESLNLAAAAAVCLYSSAKALKELP